MSRLLRHRPVLSILLAITLVAVIEGPATSAALPPLLRGEALAQDAHVVTWPPEAWDHGDIASLGIMDLALLAVAERPGTPAAASLRQQLDALESMPPVYGRVARAALEGLATARWHQETSMEGLGPHRHALPAAALDAPMAQSSAQAAALDVASLQRSLLALEATSQEILWLIEHDERRTGPGVADLLSAELGVTATPAPVRHQIPTAEDLAALISLVSGGADPVGQARAAEALEGLPDEVRVGIAVVLEAAVDIIANPGEPGALVRLGQAADAARPALDVWATLALLGQIHGGPALPAVPDPDAPLPPLTWGGLPDARRDRPAPGLAAALGALVDLLGTVEGAENIPAVASTLEAHLTKEQTDALARALGSVHAYLVAGQQVAANPPPPGFTPQRVHEWLQGFREGTIPDPHGHNAGILLAASPHLHAQSDQSEALADMMAAVQDLVPAFSSSHTVPMSPASEPPLCPDTACDELKDASSDAQETIGEALDQAGTAYHDAERRIQDAMALDHLRDTPACDGPEPPAVVLVAPILALDLCGLDSSWSSDVILSIDVGGNDTYERQAGAPFMFAPGDGGPIGLAQPVQVPVALLVDLGGSDRYDAQGIDCAQGAACAPIESMYGDFPLQPIFTNPAAVALALADAADALSRSAPVSVLVDWDGDGVDAHNTFIAGNRSQGYGVYGVLVERVGRNATLDSTYSAGHSSQGVGDAGGIARDTSALTALTGGRAQQEAARPTGVGVLARLVGSDAKANGSFASGDRSQARAEGVVSNEALTGALGALVNVAGARATSADRYTAGAMSQASATRTHSANALFVDVVGPEGTSDDRYLAGEGSRGHTEAVALNQTPTATRGVYTAVPARDQRVVFLDGAVAKLTPEGSMEIPDAVEDGAVRVDARPNVPLVASSDDVYEGAVGGYGRGAGFFLDVEGTDTYPENLDGPRNDAVWHFAGEELAEARDPQRGPYPEPACTPPPGVPACGYDTGLRDHDRDGSAGVAEVLWGEFVGLWTASDDDPDRGALPTSPQIVIDTQGQGLRATDLNRSYAAVLALGSTSETYGPNFSAAFHLDAGGDDLYLGRAGAAGMRTGADGAPLDHAQHPLSILVDVRGDDHYEAAADRAQGYGGGGATGILMDLAGSDSYIAPTLAQGVAEAGGSGILVDWAVPGNSDHNLFRATSPAQGASLGPEGAAGLGVLVSNGAHNTFDDGAEGAGLGSRDGGASLNLGSNAAPSIDHGLDDLRIVASPPGAPPRELAPGDALEVAVPHDFFATLTEPEGDDLEACWTFQFWNASRQEPALDEQTQCTNRLGSGIRNEPHALKASFEWNETFQVPTNGTDAAIPHAFPFQVRLNATDAGGKTGHAVWPLSIANEPPHLQPPAGLVPVPFGTTAAHQVGIVPAPDLDDMQATVRVDGIETDLGCWSLQAPAVQCIDWATTRVGARMRTADAGSAPVDEEGKIDMIDGEATALSEATLLYRSDEALHLIIDLAAPRAIHTVQVVASKGTSEDATFTVEGVRPDGRSALFGTLTFDAANQVQDLGLRLPYGHRLQQYESIVLRQLVDPGLQGEQQLYIREIRALGPGFATTWDRAGEHAVDYAVVDAYGGRNSTGFVVNVSPPEVDGSVPLVSLLDLAGRGAVHHASVAYAAGAPDPYLLQLATPQPAGHVCVQWGDETDPAAWECRAVEDLAFSHAWEEPDDYLILTKYCASPEGQDCIDPNPLAWVHVEEAFDLRVDGGSQAPHLPVLFLALDPDAANGTTWHIPVAGAPYMAIVDGRGDDRFIDRVAAARSATPVEGRNHGGLPSLVVDAAGDDDYLSNVNGTQGFGSFGAAALLVDVSGDDLYVAPDAAQGAGARGAGMLIDMGGHDAFNPVPPAHPAVQDMHPENAATLSAARIPRSIALAEMGRSPLRASDADLMQGAAEDGIGVLVAMGGFDTFTSGTRSQGYGAHDPGVSAHTAYASPNPECGPPNPVTGSTLGCAPNQDNSCDASTHPQPNQVDDTSCFLGLTSSQLTPTCTATFPPGICDWGLSTFATDGHRYSPSIGVLLRGDGSSTYHVSAMGQGAAGPGARGILLDFEGGFVASAIAQAQGYGLDGQALLMAGGGHAASVEQAGQGAIGTDERSPEPVERPLAEYLGMPSARHCSHDCGTPSGQDPTPTRPEGPGLSWGDGFGTGVRKENGTRLDLTVQLTPGDLGGAYELVALTQPLADWDGQGCRGRPLSPPGLVAREVGRTEDTWIVSMDLLQHLDDGPRYPAGCHTVTVLVRQHTPAGATEWSAMSGAALLLPPPRVHVDGSGLEPTGLPGLLASDSAIHFAVVATEPLAVHSGREIQVNLSLRPATDDTLPTDGWGHTRSDWQAMTPTSVFSTVRLTPPDLPASTEQGEYILCAQAMWPGESLGPCRDIARLLVDTGAPTLALPDPPVAEGGWWQAGRPLPLEIQATDLGNGVASVEARLWSTDCLASAADCRVKVRGDGFLPVSQLEAEAPADGGSLWTIDLMELDVDFPGGPVELQARATDRGGTTSSWARLLGFGLDASAPTFSGISSDAGTAATNGTFPIHFTASYTDCSNEVADQATAGCHQGSGLRAATAGAFMRQAGTAEITPLMLQGSGVLPGEVRFTWDGPTQQGPGEDTPAEGRYEILLQAEDEAGNLLVINPGTPLGVDRTPPDAWRNPSSFEPLPEVALPEGQNRTKPGDAIHVSVFALDPGTAATGIHQVEASIGDDPAAWWPMTEQEPDSAPDVYSASIQVPDDLPDGQGARIRVRVQDLAGNPTTVTNLPVIFHRHPPSVQDVSVITRPTALRAELQTDREAAVVEAFVQAGETRINGRVSQMEADRSRIDFSGVSPQMEYSLAVLLRDWAGHTVWANRSAIVTPPAIDTEVVPRQVPPLTYARNFTLEGAIQQPPGSGGMLRLLLQSSDGQWRPVADAFQLPETREGEDGLHPDQAFSFTLDSRKDVPASRQGAVEAKLRLELDDGINVTTSDLVVRFDNAAPAAMPHVLGAPARNGWHNRTVVVDAGASDETGPIAHTAVVDGTSSQQRSVRIAAEGEHTVRFLLADGATPPNEVVTPPLLVRVDRTPPQVAISTGLAGNTTRDPLVPLVVQATDPEPGSGTVDGYRVRTGQAWGPWAPTPPDNLTLPGGLDGQRWIDVQVRDAAGNVRQASQGLLLDRQPPQALAIRWIGKDAHGAPVLQLVASDAVSGVEAVRFATGSGWTPWTPTDGLDALALPATASVPGDGGSLSLRDRAGNIADLALPTVPEETNAAPAGQEGPEAPRDGRVAPLHGDIHTRFAFTVLIAPHAGQMPDSVWLRAAGTTLRMEAAGTPLDDGSRLYAAGGLLPPSRFNAPHQYWFEVRYPDQTLRTEAQSGPTVLAAGPGEVGRFSDPASDRGAPGPGTGIALLLLLPASILARRQRRNDP